LKENRITGAPVVDDGGKLVGILSMSDLVAPAGEPLTPSRPVPLDHAEGVAAWNVEGATAWELFERGGPLGTRTGVERVAQRMSRHVASVAEDATLVEAARVMCDGHWHRVPVVAAGGGLCGIISSMDVLAALVNAADEAG
ncbi:MAG TPA: CBS domain-containing protein, partial [Planctomycetaceae bacterium]|nr:CBS domain-containing protein [Planctomycetaceae bacterium]